MNKYEEALVKTRIESAENRIREIHNRMESERIGRKKYLPYESIEFIKMINLFRDFEGNINDNTLSRT